MNLAGITTTCSAKIIARWNRIFRKNGRWPHPDPFVANGKPKPPLFDYFPKIAVDVSGYILDHLNHFSVEMLKCELATNIIPTMMKEIEKDEQEFEEKSDG